jgi:16S rRNA (guanine(966)-N(2))-methyltransferase RsmD
MRVIAGQYRSRRLASLPGMDLRPTSDRLRETLFNVLTAGNPSALVGTTWVDLFAGTGAVGIEALSRGAGQVYFVDVSRQATQLIAKNLAGLQIRSGADILTLTAVQALQQLGGQCIRADFVFLDPPYRKAEAYRDTLEALASSQIVAPATVVIAEHERKFDPGDWFGDLARYRKLEQGDAVLSFYQAAATSCGP